MLAHFLLLTFLHLTASYIVMPDDSYYPNATCIHCHNLQYYLLNSSKFFTPNTQLLFLPGLHYLHTDFIIENVYNVSIIGRNSDISSIIQCNSLVGIIMKNITNLSVENMTIKNCQTNSFSAALVITECNAVKLLYLTIYNLPHHQRRIYGTSLLGYNIMDNLYLNHITCDEQLRFYYNETNATIADQVIFLDHYNIIHAEDFTQTYAIYVQLSEFSNSLMFQISNITIKTGFLKVKSKCIVKCNTIVFTNCGFNDYNYKIKQRLLSLININVCFTNCHFVNHAYYRGILIETTGGETLVISYCIFHHNRIHGGLIYTGITLSNITIEHCEFHDNTATIIYDYASIFPDFNCAKIVTIFIKNTTFFANKLSASKASLISIGCSRLLLIGPVKFRRNSVASITFLKIFVSTLIEVRTSTITIYGYIEFSQNAVGSLIEYVKCAIQECLTMNVADNATLIIANNRIGVYFTPEWNSHYSFKKLNYPLCFFQYLNSSTTDTNYLIIFNKNKVNLWFSVFDELVLIAKIGYGAQAAQKVNYKGGLPITHCYWSPHSAFTATIPLDVNGKYIKFINNSEDLPPLNNKKLLCYCTNDTHYDCYKDDLGYLYPGQTASVPFCYPENFTTFNYIEVSVDISINGTYFTPCVIHDSRELIQFTSKICTRLQYTITF